MPGGAGGPGMEWSPGIQRASVIARPPASGLLQASGGPGARETEAAGRAARTGRAGAGHSRLNNMWIG